MYFFERHSNSMLQQEFYFLCVRRWLMAGSWWLASIRKCLSKIFWHNFYIFLKSTRAVDNLNLIWNGSKYLKAHQNNCIDVSGRTLFSFCYAVWLYFALNKYDCIIRVCALVFLWIMNWWIGIVVCMCQRV